MPAMAWNNQRREGVIMAGIALNEDNSHYFSTRAGQRLDEGTVASWVDQYAGTQVTELLLCPNCMRTSYDSAVWDPIWRGYDPEAGDDQPLLVSRPPDEQPESRKWIHTAWQLAHDGIDVYAVWIARCRQAGISPWLSMRMNDVHWVDDEQAYIHSEFWRSRPDLRRVPYRFSTWTDRAFDYGQAEVREYHMRLIRELAERYDFDGLELDWMRFGHHFRPGHELEGGELLTAFTAEVRRLLDEWEDRRGHSIRLGARVPSRPDTARRLGMDAVTWARQGLIDWLVVTPFFATAETDLPLELWKALLDGTGITLCAGLEILLRPYDAFPRMMTNSLETARGAAASFLDRGADRVYLFNYFDSVTAMDDLYNYPALLREVGEEATLRGKYRRHVLTFADTWAPGEPRACPLPVVVGAGQPVAFRLSTGPLPTSGATEVLLGALTGEIEGMEVRLNGDVCSPRGERTLQSPSPDGRVHAFGIPPAALRRGDNVIEVCPTDEVTVGWVEIGIRPDDG